MRIRKLAGIDIGSNGVRLLIVNVLEVNGEDPVFSKSSLVRVPIRLGSDVFTIGAVSQENQERLTDAIKAFQLIMDLHKVEAFDACATSAMREASNGAEICRQIKEQTQIDIRIIDGSAEAAIIASTDLYSIIAQDKTYLYIDVGGGSTEFTVFSKGKEVASRSFPIGTVRLLNDMVSSKMWSEAEQWVRTQTAGFGMVEAIGSGGNINKIFRESGRKNNQPLTYKYLSDYAKYLAGFTYEERIRDLGLNPDRADVIVPATKIYLNAMRWSKAKNIHVPRIGLADGIVKSLYAKIQFQKR